MISTLSKNIIDFVAANWVYRLFGIAMWMLSGGFIVFLYIAYGWQKSALAITGLAIGVVFFRCQFGFSYTWRVLFTRGDGTGLRAQMLWIALAALPFAWLSGNIGGGDVYAVMNVRPLTTGIAVGALLFGVGMQLGGACTSGSIVGAGQGGTVPFISIAGFIAGAIVAAEQAEFWQELPAATSFSFYGEWGIWGALAIIAMGIVVILASLTLPLPSNSSAPPPKRMSLYVGAIILALLSIILLALAKQPWGIINGLSILGAKTLFILGYEDIEFWDYWSRFATGSDALHSGWFEGTQLVTTVSMLLGVVVAAVAAGKFSLSFGGGKRLLLSLSGGVIMGYGAQISYGCNIGSYISALSSGSAHGWLWLFFAFVGTAIGVGARRLVGLDK